MYLAKKKYALRYGQSLKSLEVLLGMQVIHTKETPMQLLHQIILRTIQYSILFPSENF